MALTTAQKIIGCHKKPRNFNRNSKNKMMTFFHLKLPIRAYRAQSSLGEN